MERRGIYVKKGGGTGQVCLCVTSDKPQQNERINLIHFIQTPFFPSPKTQFPKQKRTDFSLRCVLYMCTGPLVGTVDPLEKKINKQTSTQQKKKKIV